MAWRAPAAVTERLRRQHPRRGRRIRKRRGAAPPPSAARRARAAPAGVRRRWRPATVSTCRSPRRPGERPLAARAAVGSRNSLRTSSSSSLPTTSCTTGDTLTVPSPSAHRFVRRNPAGMTTDGGFMTVRSGNHRAAERSARSGSGEQVGATGAEGQGQSVLSTVEGDKGQVVLGAHLGDQCVVDVASEVELDGAGDDRRDGGRGRRQDALRTAWPTGSQPPSPSPPTARTCDAAGRTSRRARSPAAECPRRGGGG